MWSLLDLVTADIISGPTISDVVGLVLLIAFVGFFVVFGFLALRKKRRERIEALARELDRPGLSTDAERASLPAIDAEGGDVVPALPKAAELVAAEREALLRRAEADAAARAAARASERAAALVDDEEKGRALAAEEAARQEAAAAKAAHEAALEQARALRVALHRTRDGLMGRLSSALLGKSIDAAVLDDVENVLFTADIGVRTAERLLQAVKTKLSRSELTSLDKIEATLKAEATAILASVESKPLAIDGPAPRVVLVLGVNGAGKTTTIGKLAAQLKGSGKSVLLAAGDTFRAAAADQLEVWAKRADVPIVSGPDGGDPSSVIFDAIKKAQADGVDVVLCDTAGRLHTKTNLMEELKKVARSIAKACPGAPHEVILVLDATVGQNAIAQAKQFGEAAPLSGIILTKLDGTAKGGVVLGIVDELKVPVRYIGVGEKLADLRPFVAHEFVAALFSDSVGAPPQS